MYGRNNRRTIEGHSTGSGRARKRIIWIAVTQEKNVLVQEETVCGNQSAEAGNVCSVITALSARCVERSKGQDLGIIASMSRRRQWQPTPVFLPGESQGRGSLVGCRLWGRTELDMTEAT